MVLSAKLTYPPVADVIILVRLCRRFFRGLCIARMPEIISL